VPSGVFSDKIVNPRRGRYGNYACNCAYSRCCSSADTTAGLGGQDGHRRGIKRSRCEDFNTAWQSLFKLRWPLGVKPGHDSVVTVDWQQQYWEKHLQECLDEATESALLPSFRGGIGELSISGWYPLSLPDMYAIMSLLLVG